MGRTARASETQAPVWASVRAKVWSVGRGFEEAQALIGDQVLPAAGVDELNVECVRELHSRAVNPCSPAASLGAENAVTGRQILHRRQGWTANFFLDMSGSSGAFAFRSCRSH